MLLFRLRIVVVVEISAVPAARALGIETCTLGLEISRR